MKHCKTDDIGFVFPYFVLIILKSMNMGIFPGNMLVYSVCDWHKHRAEESIQFLGTRFTDGSGFLFALFRFK